MKEDNRPREIMSRLMRVNRMHRSMVEKRFKELGVHRSQHMMLIHLKKSEEPVSQKVLAEHFDVTPAAIAMSLKKMEKNGLIERTSSEQDSRVNIISLSEKGRAVLEETRELFGKMDASAICGIADEQLEIVCTTLDKMIENLIDFGAVDDICLRFSKCNTENGKERKTKTVNEKMV